jgi:hypothetical protein
MLLPAALLSALLQVVSPPPLIDDRNDTAASKERTTVQSIVCRQNDRITVQILNGRIRSVDVSGRNITDQVANAVDVPVDHVAFECREKTFFLMPYSDTGAHLGVLSLRYD